MGLMLQPNHAGPLRVSVGNKPFGAERIYRFDASQNNKMCPEGATSGPHFLSIIALKESLRTEPLFSRAEGLKEWSFMRC